MHCKKCGRFMRREGFTIANPSITHWYCNNDGWGYSVKGKKRTPLFSKAAMVLVMEKGRIG